LAGFLLQTFKIPITEIPDRIFTERGLVHILPTELPTRRGFYCFQEGICKVFMNEHNEYARAPHTNRKAEAQALCYFGSFGGIHRSRATDDGSSALGFAADDSRSFGRLF
jgi:hypothetical protein